MTSPSYIPGAVEPTGFITTTQPPKRRGRWVWLAVGAVGAVIIVAAAVLLLSGRSFDVTGSLVLNAGCGEAGSGGYRDIGPGTQVVVSDATGKTIAAGALGAGEVVANRCQYDFTVEGVPTGHDFYGVEVSHRGRLQYPAEKIRDPVIVSLG